HWVASGSGAVLVHLPEGETSISLDAAVSKSIQVTNVDGVSDILVGVIVNDPILVSMSAGISSMKGFAVVNGATLVRVSSTRVSTLSMGGAANNATRIMIAAADSLMSITTEGFYHERDIAEAMYESVPPIFTRIDEYKQIQKAQSTELHRFAALREEALNDLSYVDRLSLKGVRKFETRLKIPTDESKSLLLRRDAIKNRLQGPGLIQESTFNEMMNTFYDTTVEQDRAHDIVRTTIWSKRGIPDNISEMEEVAEDVLPIYLEHEFIPTWLTWGEIEEYG
ncbi:putative phage tail protein, partial [Paenibacillus shunpengii]